MYTRQRRLNADGEELHTGASRGSPSKAHAKKPNDGGVADLDVLSLDTATASPARFPRMTHDDVHRPANQASVDWQDEVTSAQADGFTRAKPANVPANDYHAEGRIPSEQRDRERCAKYRLRDRNVMLDRLLKLPRGYNVPFRCEGATPISPEINDAIDSGPEIAKRTAVAIQRLAEVSQDVGDLRRTNGEALREVDAMRRRISTQLQDHALALGLLLSADLRP